MSVENCPQECVIKNEVCANATQDTCETTAPNECGQHQGCVLKDQKCVEATDAGTIQGTNNTNAGNGKLLQGRKERIEYHAQVAQAIWTP